MSEKQEAWNVAVHLEGGGRTGMNFICPADAGFPEPKGMSSSDYLATIVGWSREYRESPWYFTTNLRFAISVTRMGVE